MFSLYCSTLLARLRIFFAPYAALVAFGHLHAATVTFNNYASGTNNDLVNNFIFTSQQAVYTTSTSGGITGGALIPATDNSFRYLRYKAKLTPTTCTTAVSFKYDASKLNPNNNGQVFPTVGIGLRAGSHDAGSSISVYVDGNGESGPRFGASGSNAGQAVFNEAPVNGHWYRLVINFSNTGGPFSAIDVSYQLLHLGADGMQPPTLLSAGEYSPNVAPGSTTISYTHSNTTLSQATTWNVFLGAGSWGGCGALDNFELTPASGPVGLTSPSILVYNYAAMGALTGDGSASIKRISAYLVIDQANQFFTLVRYWKTSGMPSKRFVVEPLNNLVLARVTGPANKSWMTLYSATTDEAPVNPEVRVLFLKGKGVQVKTSAAGKSLAAPSLVGMQRNVSRAVVNDVPEVELEELSLKLTLNTAVSMDSNNASDTQDQAVERIRTLLLNAGYTEE